MGKEELTKVCVICSKEFKTKKEYKEWCSTLCHYHVKKKPKIKVCTICENKFESYTTSTVCGKECRKVLTKKTQDDNNIRQHIKKKIKELGEDGYKELPKCLLCTEYDYHADDLRGHVSGRHNMTIAEYREKFNLTTKDTMSEKTLKLYSDNIKGDKNPGYQHGGKYSPFSPKFYIRKGYSEEESIKMARTKEREAKANTPRENLNTCIEYYLKQGLSLEDAKKAQSKRQVTFSKEICIEKYGEEEGIERWEERQNKWMKSLDDKSDEEKMIMNRKKCSWGCNVSKAEKEIYFKLKESIIDVESSFIIDSTKGYVYDIAYKNKIIEYNGIWWHCKPELYEEDFYNKSIKMTAKEKWQKDKVKNDFAKERGYDVLVIWEDDYKKDPESTIQQCLEFLNA